MDRLEALRRARRVVGGPSDRFDVRAAFGERRGKQIIFPVGLGSALTKAVREGYLRVVGDGAGRRRRTYEFTRKGLDLLG